ncbi:Phosphoglycolate phosphatase [Marinomonas spartinae]|nr:Phosphoglycolate phosphatase [Marinomonas spartinae]
MAALERDGLIDLIDEVIGGDKVKDPKPSPEGLNMAIRASKIDKQEALYVGDSKSDGLAARAAGVGYVAVLTGMTPRENLNEFNPIKIIDDLKELNQVVCNFCGTSD